jgi:hypothetical protein
MTCFAITGAFQHPDVNIGWFPFRATRDTTIRTIPGAGNVISPVEAGQGLGVQSVRNPRHESQIERRQAERAGDGTLWLWCYRRQGSKTGWICIDDIEADSDPHKPPLKGPAGLDFEVGRTAPGHKSPSGCGDDIRDRSRKERTRVVKAQDVYLRYSPRGTGKHYLHRGDKVLLILASGPHGFVFVDVLTSTEGSPAQPGTRGWLSAAALQRA